MRCACRQPFADDSVRCHSGTLNDRRCWLQTADGCSLVSGQHAVRRQHQVPRNNQGRTQRPGDRVGGSPAARCRARLWRWRPRPWSCGSCRRCPAACAGCGRSTVHISAHVSEMASLAHQADRLRTPLAVDAGHENDSKQPGCLQHRQYGAIMHRPRRLGRASCSSCGAEDAGRRQLSYAARVTC